MSTTQTLILGAIAGFTIFVGLPIGRVRSTSAALRASLTAVATGILVFLLLGRHLARRRAGRDASRARIRGARSSGTPRCSQSASRSA